MYFDKNFHAISNIIKALSFYSNTTIIFTSPNCDAHNKVIIKKINEFIKKNNNASFFQHFGSDLYLSLLKASNLIIGNSSSGVIEAPSLKTPTINLGKRQKGDLVQSLLLTQELSIKK